MSRVHLLPATLLLVLLLAACGEDASPAETVANPFGIDGMEVELEASDSNGDPSEPATPYFSGAIPLTTFDDVPSVPDPDAVSGGEVDISVASLDLEPTGADADALPSSIEIERVAIQSLELIDGGSFESGGTKLVFQATQDGLGWSFQAESACDAGAACSYRPSGGGVGPLTIEFSEERNDYENWAEIVAGGLSRYSVRASLFVEFATASDAATAILELEVDDARVFLETARY